LESKTLKRGARGSQKSEIKNLRWHKIEPNKYPKSRLREKGLKERGKGSWKSLKTTRINIMDPELVQMEASERMQQPRDWEAPFLAEAIIPNESKPSNQV
jgi:hypothetical protein